MEYTKDISETDFPDIYELPWPPRQVTLMRSSIMYRAWHPLTRQEIADRTRRARRLQFNHNNP